MAIQVAYPHLVEDEGQPARLERWPRIRVAMIVMDYLAHGWSVEEMCRQHEYLSLSEAHAAMLYYWDHQDEIDREIREECELVERLRATESPSPFELRMRREGKM